MVIGFYGTSGELMLSSSQESAWLPLALAGVAHPLA